jgi:hypothetical protein
MDRMVLAGLLSGSSFKASVTVSGGNVSATFSLQDARRPSSNRPHTARPAVAAPFEPAVQQLPVRPLMAPAPAAAALQPSDPPLCNFFAAGLCKHGRSCKFSHGIAQQAPKAPQKPQPQAAPAMIPSAVVEAAAAAPSKQRPSTARGPRDPAPAPAAQPAAPPAATPHRDAAAGGGLVARMAQAFDKPITVRPTAAATPPKPRQMQCMICLDNGMSNEGVVCPKGGHFLHRACLDHQITARCEDYLRSGPCKPSLIACPHNGYKCCVYTSEQLRLEAGGASAQCIALLDRVAAAEKALKKLPTAEQLRQANQDAYMCPQCKFGPVAHYACSNVSYQGNRCPKCNFHTDNISGWSKWDGKFTMQV